MAGQDTLHCLFAFFLVYLLSQHVCLLVLNCEFYLIFALDH